LGEIPQRVGQWSDVNCYCFHFATSLHFRKNPRSTYWQKQSGATKRVSIAIYFLNSQNFGACLAILRFAGYLGLSHIIFDGLITIKYRKQQNRDTLKSMMEHIAELIIDDRNSNALLASNGMVWRVVSDTVMGGVSSGKLIPTVTEGRHCLRLTGDVSLDNNGGFVQASLDLFSSGLLDASDYLGIQIEIYGNSEVYNLHLRTEGHPHCLANLPHQFPCPPALANPAAAL
jgi:hypothetical protein